MNWPLSSAFSLVSYLCMDYVDNKQLLIDRLYHWMYFLNLLFTLNLIDEEVICYKEICFSLSSLPMNLCCGYTSKLCNLVLKLAISTRHLFSASIYYNVFLILRCWQWMPSIIILIKWTFSSIQLSSYFHRRLKYTLALNHGFIPVYKVKIIWQIIRISS